MSGLNARLQFQRGDGFQLDVELDIAAGETVALLGPNGAGKSTCVDLLAGLLPLAAGHITLDDRTLDNGDRVFVPPNGRSIGVVFQDYLLFDHMSVLDNIAFGLSASGASAAKATAEAGRWAQLFDLADLVSVRPTELSGGQAQRVALARAVANEPRLLLLDEPLAALDVETRSATRRLLARRLHEFDGPRLLITHDPADAFLLADRIYLLEAGVITQSGTPTEIRLHPATTYGATVAGTNLLTGTNAAGSLTLDDHDHELQTADTGVSGAVLITIHPRAISLHLAQPEGSPRNTWPTVVDGVEPLGDTTRILLGAPLPISADITPGSTRALGLERGTAIWASVKATEISVSAAT